MKEHLKRNCYIYFSIFWFAFCMTRAFYEKMPNCLNVALVIVSLVLIIVSCVFINLDTRHKDIGTKEIRKRKIDIFHKRFLIIDYYKNLEENYYYLSDKQLLLKLYDQLHSLEYNTFSDAVVIVTFLGVFIDAILFVLKKFQISGVSFAIEDILKIYLCMFVGFVVIYLKNDSKSSECALVNDFEAEIVRKKITIIENRLYHNKRKEKKHDEKKACCYNCCRFNRNRFRCVNFSRKETSH